MRAGAHRGNRGFLPDRAGDDDEGDVEIELLHDPQRGDGAEAGQIVVAEDQVPGLRSERRFGARGGVDAQHVEEVAGMAKTVRQQQGVVLVVFDHQDLQTARQGGFDGHGAGRAPRDGRQRGNYAVCGTSRQIAAPPKPLGYNRPPAGLAQLVEQPPCKR